MNHWHVFLDNFPADSGDVVTKYGEVIGTYTCDDVDFCEFTPLGESSPTISDVMVGPFCKKIADWHEQAEASRGAAI